MVATSTYMLVFRILHIMAGAAWAGSVFLFVVLIQPSAASVGPAAGPFMMELLGRRKMVAWLLSLAGTTVVAGLFLYWRVADGFAGYGDFVTSRYGAVLTLGSLAAIGAFLIGMFGTRPNVARLLELSGRAAGSEGGPPPELAQSIGRVQVRLRRLARTALGLIAIAVFAMATARYW
jgi:hypothetical protein